MRKISPQQRREHSDPHENNRPVPQFVLVLAGLLGIYGVGYILIANPNTPAAWGDGRTMVELSAGSATTPGNVTNVLDGAALFTARCAACHQATGTGLAGVFPPLANSEWVKGADRTLVAIVLNGIEGELTVNGTKYNGVMPSFKGMLNDAEIAAITSYIRGAWGNGGGHIAPQLVTEMRKETAERSPFHGDEDLPKFGK